MEQSPESKIHNPKWSKHREVKTQSTRQIQQLNSKAGTWLRRHGNKAHEM